MLDAKERDAEKEKQLASKGAKEAAAEAQRLAAQAAARAKVAVKAGRAAQVRPLLAPPASVRLAWCHEARGACDRTDLCSCCLRCPHPCRGYFPALARAAPSALACPGARSRACGQSPYRTRLFARASWRSSFLHALLLVSRPLARRFSALHWRRHLGALPLGLMRMSSTGAHAEVSWESVLESSPSLAPQTGSTSDRQPERQKA